MQPHTRRAVAFIAGRAISGSDASAVYDYSESRYVFFSGDVSAGNVNVYDHEENCHVGGSLPSLYHYGNGQHIQLDVSGTQFNGFDYGSGQHFSGTVNGQAVSVYDYEHGQYSNYSV
jgi:hypothetical protein